jgi:hypothetical protein
MRNKLTDQLLKSSLKRQETLLVVELASLCFELGIPNRNILTDNLHFSMLVATKVITIISEDKHGIGE